MFSRCCWSKSKSKDKDRLEMDSGEVNNVVVITKNGNDDDGVNNKHRCESNELPILEVIQDTGCTNKKSSDSFSCSNEQMKQIESSLPSDNDDEVFSESVQPVARLADNLGVISDDYKRLEESERGDVNGRVPLPKWFQDSAELDDPNTSTVESDAPTTPPATPVGKDELALRRHRLFSEIIDIAQHSSEHRVKFDPFGPVIAGVADDNNQRSDLEELICRLESVTTRLENLCLPLEHLELLLNASKSPQSENNNQQQQHQIDDTMSVQGFSDIIGGPLAQYIQISQQIGGDVLKHSQLVVGAFEFQRQYLVLASQSKQPAQAEVMNLLRPTSTQISEIQSFREKNRTSPFFNHLSAISESIPALGWVTVSPAPSPFVKEMNDAGQFYTNRVLKDWKEKDKKHVEWVKAWVQTLADLQAFVKQYHTTGLVWAGKNAVAAGGPPPPPPGGCPPPPPVIDFDACNLNDGGGDNDRSALFAQINQGENITRSLKKVTSDMQTHKNPTLREGPAPFKTPSHGQGSRAGPPVDKPPTFVRDGKKWIIEYQKGNQNLVVENAEMNNVVYLFKCTDSTITIKGKINSITLDSCKKTSVVFESLVSSMEFINCQSVQMQVLGKVPTISIDKTDGCQMYLSPDSLAVEIVSSKSSEMNVLVPKGNGDYTEYAVPEQYKTTVVPGKGLSTIIVENQG